MKRRGFLGSLLGAVIAAPAAAKALANTEPPELAPPVRDTPMDTYYCRTYTSCTLTAHINSGGLLAWPTRR